ncbi:MAG: polysaccharide biosynthesis tyrosine autokinase [Alphaproteobacteria bacterium]
MNMMNKIEEQPNPNGAPLTIGDILGINAVVQTIRRRFLAMALVAIAVAAAMFAYQMSRPRVYQATALISIVTREERVVDHPGVVGDLPRDSSAIDSEIELLRSPALMNKLADAVRLVEHQVTPGKTIAQDVDTAATTVTGDTSGADTRPLDPLAQRLSGQIQVRRRGLTYVIEVSARDPNPARAQLIANTFADVYIASQVETRVAINEHANVWLSQRLEQLRQDVQQKESAAETYRVQHGLTAAQGNSLVENQITNVQTQVLQAQADLAEKEARYEQLRQMQASGSSADTIANALNSGTIQSLRDREADIARRQTDLENRYLPTHPAVQAVRAERADVEQQIQNEIQRIAANLSNEVDVARARLRTLQGSLSQVTGQLNADSADSVHLHEVEREAAASREVYEAYLQRYQEIANQDQLNMSDARLMAYAQRPGAPAEPNFKLSLVIALALGIAVGVAVGIALEIFDQSVKNADDIEKQVGLAAIASVPNISGRMMRLLPPGARTPADYLVARPMSAFTEALRVLRTVIVYSKLDLSTRVVAVTSAVPDEGKTTISVCLARVAAMSGQKAVVVDCDLRKQSINDIIDVSTDVGLLHVLAGEKSWREAIVHDPSSEADVLPVATPSFTSRDVFGSDAMARLVAELRREYDLVILDCAPILAVAETRVIVKHADTVVVVARAGKSAVGAVRTAISQTEAAGGNVLGVALNCVEPRSTSYADALYFQQANSYYSVS